MKRPSISSAISAEPSERENMKNYHALADENGFRLYHPNFTVASFAFLLEELIETSAIYSMKLFAVARGDTPSAATVPGVSKVRLHVQLVTCYAGW